MGDIFIENFIAMFVFYTNVKMITISDPDDWTYISKIRIPVPSLNEYNPAKVFPETIMGLCGYFAAYVIYPIIGDYTWSMTFVYASVVSLAIAVSIAYVCVLINNLLHCNLWTSISGSLVFFLLHFIIFKAGENNNNFLLTASNLNCFMNYTIPLLSCFIMAMFIFKEYINCENDKPCYLGSGKKTIIIGLVLLWSYLNIFSNMICNIILVAPITFLFLRNALIALKGKSFNKKFFIENYMYEYILLLEMICLFFEGNGNRSASFEVNWMSAIENTLHDLKSIVGIIDKKIIVLCVLIVVAKRHLNCIFQRKGWDNIRLLVKESQKQLSCAYILKHRGWRICIVMIVIAVVNIYKDASLYGFYKCLFMDFNWYLYAYLLFLLMLPFCES